MYDFENDYELDKELGHGMDGRVYLATSIRDGVRVAIKICKKSAKREIDILEYIGKLPGVCELFEWRREKDDVLVLVMEYMENSMDLFEYRRIQKGGRFDVQTSMRIFRELVRIVKRLKSIDVYHCDLKLENIMINIDTLELKLIDFNRSVIIRDDESLGKYVGTSDYCPPEWFLESKCRAEPAAVWSLGIILYEMLTGIVPFQNETNVIIDDIEEKINLSLPEDVIHLLKNMLNKTPDARYRLDDL